MASQSSFRVSTPRSTQASRPQKRSAPAPAETTPAPAPARRRVATTQPPRWTAEFIEQMLNELVELANEGKQTDNQGFKGSDLADVARKLIEKGGNYDAKRIRSKYDDLKKNWKEWLKHLGRVSGWGKTDDGAPMNTKEIEDEYFKKYPEAKPFRRKTPAYMEQLEILLGSVSASGIYATSIDDALNDEDEDEHEDEPRAENGEEREEGRPEGLNPIDVEDPGAVSDSSTDTLAVAMAQETPSSRNIPASQSTSGTPARAAIRPSASRGHKKDDQTAAAFERSMSRSSAAIMELARAHQQMAGQISAPAAPPPPPAPIESALTRAIARITDLPEVLALEPRRRISLMRELKKEGNADIVLGLRQDDLWVFAESMLSDMDDAAAAATAVRNGIGRGQGYPYHPYTQGYGPIDPSLGQPPRF